MPISVLMRCCSAAAICVAVRRRACAGQHLAAHLDRVEIALARDDELVLARELAVREDDLLDLRREHVDAADDQHVVASGR